MGHFFYSLKAFDVLERLDPNPEYWEGKRGACVGAFQKIVAGKEPRDSLREITQMLRNTQNPQVEYIMRTFKVAIGFWIIAFWICYAFRVLSRILNTNSSLYISFSFSNDTATLTRVFFAEMGEGQRYQAKLMRGSTKNIISTSPNPYSN
jgi:hypothetical protein